MSRTFIYSFAQCWASFFLQVKSGWHRTQTFLPVYDLQFIISWNTMKQGELNPSAVWILREFSFGWGSRRVEVWTYLLVHHSLWINSHTDKTGWVCLPRTRLHCWWFCAAAVWRCCAWVGTRRSSAWAERGTGTRLPWRHREAETCHQCCWVQCWEYQYRSTCTLSWCTSRCHLQKMFDNRHKNWGNFRKNNFLCCLFLVLGCGWSVMWVFWGLFLHCVSLDRARKQITGGVALVWKNAFVRQESLGTTFMTHFGSLQARMSWKNRSRRNLKILQKLARPEWLKNLSQCMVSTTEAGCSTETCMFFFQGQWQAEYLRGSSIDVLRRLNFSSSRIFCIVSRWNPLNSQ